jgi:hypothetical protein
MVVGDSRGSDDWVRLPHAALVSTLIQVVSDEVFRHFNEARQLTRTSIVIESKRSPDERSDIRVVVYPRISLRSCGLPAQLHFDANGADR